MSVKVAVGQMVVAQNKQENLRKIDLLVAQAAQQSAELIVFPEACMHGFGQETDSLTDVAEPLEGTFVLSLRDLARTYHIAIMAGFFESSVDASRVFNTVAVIDGKGELKDCYRKIHLYDAFGRRESDRVLAGDGNTVIAEIGDMKFGVMTCYDLRFPELARYLAYQGAEALVLCSAWYQGPLKESQLEILSRARAIENNVYMVVSQQIGQEFAGTSMIVDPMGIVQASATEPEGVLVSELKGERVTAVREISPTLQNRRNDIYSRWREEKWYEEG